jgi:hypothetical protein
MKKYLVFGHKDHYPSGGIRDLIYSTNDFEEGKAYIDNWAERKSAEGNYYSLPEFWQDHTAHIYCTQTNKPVYEVP